MKLQSGPFDASGAVAAGGWDVGKSGDSVDVGVVVSTDGDVHLTKGALVAGQTAAAIPVVAVLARSAVLARVRLAFVDIHLAVVAFRMFVQKQILFPLHLKPLSDELPRNVNRRTGETGATEAVIAADSIDAGASVTARTVPAFVPVGLALVSGVSVLAETRIVGTVNKK